MNAIPIRVLEGLDIPALAQAALYTEAVKVNCPEPQYTEAIASAFNAAENFRAALRVVTGLDDAMIRRLIKEGILP